jgi:hypothetical protein
MLDRSTLCAADSHAKTLATQGGGLESTGLAQVFGQNNFGSLASYDQRSQSWKTSQLSLLEEWVEFLETWPESGTTRNGQLFLRAPWAQHMCDEECSLWPTPTASMDGRGFGIPLHERSGRYRLSTVRRVHALVGLHGWRIHPHFTEALMGFPLGWTEITQSEMP